MTAYDIGQYAPHVLAGLCLIGLVGIPGPTVQKPNTWHMTFFIVMCFSLLNIFLSPFYEYFQSADRILEAGGDLGDPYGDDYKRWMVNNAYVATLSSSFDFFTAALVIKFSQKGRRRIALFMGAFLLVNVMVITHIVSFVYLNYSLGAFSWLLKYTYIVNSNYSWLILMLNIGLFAALFGGLNGWTGSNITAIRRAIGDFLSGDRPVLGVHRLFNLLRRQRPSERVST